MNGLSRNAIKMTFLTRFLTYSEESNSNGFIVGESLTVTHVDLHVKLVLVG